MSELENRIQSLEEENAYLRQDLDTLDLVVQKQASAIEKLQRQLLEISDGLESLGDFVRESPANGVNR